MLQYFQIREESPAPTIRRFPLTADNVMVKCQYAVPPCRPFGFTLNDALTAYAGLGNNGTSDFCVRCKGKCLRRSAELAAVRTSAAKASVQELFALPS